MFCVKRYVLFYVKHFLRNILFYVKLFTYLLYKNGFAIFFVHVFVSFLFRGSCVVLSLLYRSSIDLLSIVYRMSIVSRSFLDRISNFCAHLHKNINIETINEKNKELIQEILPLYVKYNVTFKHIKAHTSKKKRKHTYKA